MKDLKLICALATWRMLRKEDKSQNDIIAIFCKNVIRQKFETIGFNEEDLQRELKENYGFDLPNAIIKEVLEQKMSDILEKPSSYDLANRTNYRLKEKINDDSLKIMDSYSEKYKKFSRHLILFIESKTQNKYSEQDTLNLFNEYLLYDKIDKAKNQEIFAYFADFLLHNEEKYDELLQTIKEGAILYEGLTYHVEKKKELNKLILFLDVEILFSAMGYNGSLYKQKFDEFYDLACKYDDNSYGLRMPLFYDECIKEEIEHFFHSARQIKKARNANYKRTAAMDYLMQNFNDVGEIDSEETRFFTTLENDFNIKVYKREKYNDLLDKYPQFNLESQESLEKIKGKIKEKSKSYKDNYENEMTIDENMQQAIKSLNFINLMRRSYPKKFFEAKVFLITNTSIINNIAWDESFMENKSIPLSTKLDFITARLWGLLESSFGSKLKSLNPIFRIQILLKE